ncbi:uncharacterized protein LOC131627353 [Vicia villosa]|uniref:uncharacterized protein LOC131627353 n=1 Tax=Vicia villosa TaxID=3911 RepID=UPI00273B0C9C|nr:uncharacterized protein LOC131627353 [Vicia villosa]
METQKSQVKLTRTQSSLLNLSSSSPTIRSSFQSLSSINDYNDEEDDKNNKKKIKKSSYYNNSSPRSGSTRITAPVIAVVSFSFLGVCSFIFYFSFLGSDEVPTSENLLLALIFIAVALYFASRNKGLINHGVSVVKQWYDGNVKRFGLTKTESKPVQWFIGGSTTKGVTTTKKKSVREGVEFYSNGDFYEGEFHKGRSNGSGVYNYFVNGRYEGDWVDGRYDGYGIESWARGSRYKGQYRKGMRHGYGVYRFYTGDSFSGEWCNGQSHGMGLQTCSDASTYVGQFKHGVKHGLGCYHFRNGDRYAGEYFGDKIHGFGVYHFANGHCYEGAWHDGRRQGIGSYTFRTGDRRCGEWDAGNLKHSLPPLTDVVLRAIEAARKTAADAINLKSVDDHVNNAVIAANKAATAARVAAVKAVQNRMDGKFCETFV